MTAEEDSVDEQVTMPAGAPPTSPTRTDPVYTVTTAAAVCELTCRAILGHLDVLASAGAYEDEHGAWVIPGTALATAGLLPQQVVTDLDAAAPPVIPTVEDLVEQAQPAPGSKSARRRHTA